MIAQRIVEFFHRNLPQGDSGLSSTWLGIIGTYQAELHTALITKDTAAVERILLNPGTAMWGIENGTPIDFNGEDGKRMLSALACRIGVLPMFNPEQPSPSKNWQATDYQKLRTDVEAIVGPLTVPSGFVFYGDPPGFPSHHFFRLSEWFTVESFLGYVPKRILEIGAGIGSLGMVAFGHGSESYTVIDIPTTAAMSAFFIAKAIGEEKVYLSGESENEKAFARWYTCYDFKGAEGEYDLIVNCNSFPEMTTQFQDEYVNFISRSLSPTGVFYSCNHESDLASQWRVLAAVQRHGGFKMVYRAPFIPRAGYVEEIYRRK